VIGLLYKSILINFSSEDNMELRGDFQSYTEILDLLQIITMGKKSGEVNLRSGNQSITIYFREGKAIDFTSNVPPLQKLRERVAVGELPLEEAINFLLHHVSLWESGKFLFTEKPISYDGIGKADTLNIMMNFTKEEDELPKEVKEAIKENRRFTLSEEANLPITITQEGWRLLVAVCKRIPIWNALLEKGRSFSEDTKTLAELISRQLIKPYQESYEEEITSEAPSKEEKVSRFIPQEKLERIRELLVETMGPMGEFLIEETLDELEVSNLPVDMVGKFIETLLEKIPDSCLVEGEKCRDKLREEFLQLLGGGNDEA
jgi:hypothetical protein